MQMRLSAAGMEEKGTGRGPDGMDRGREGWERDNSLKAIIHRVLIFRSKCTQNVQWPGSAGEALPNTSKPQWAARERNTFESQ